MSIFAQRLKEIRKEKGLLQEHLANKLDVRGSTVGNWETGYREPSLDMVRRICIVLECDANYLLGVKDL